jgi:hypothetical protein
MIGQMTKKDMIQNRKHGMLSLENCFDASDVIYETTLWALTYFKKKLGKLTKDKLFLKLKNFKIGFNAKNQLVLR